MARKYNPVHEVDYDWGETRHYARMQESKHGQWIPLKVFEDEQARLNAMILKLKKQLNKKLDA